MHFVRIFFAASRLRVKHLPLSKQADWKWEGVLLEESDYEILRIPKENFLDISN